jgi:hypothetical protein
MEGGENAVVREMHAQELWKRLEDDVSAESDADIWLAIEEAQLTRDPSNLVPAEAQWIPVPNVFLYCCHPVSTCVDKHVPLDSLVAAIRCAIS